MHMPRRPFISPVGKPVITTSFLLSLSGVDGVETVVRVTSRAWNLVTPIVLGS